MVLAFTAISANAADAVTGLYVGGSYGMATTDLSASNSNQNLTVADKADQSFGVRLGYRFYKNWVVEGGYADLGTMKYRQPGWSNGAIKTTAGWADVVGIVPIGERFAVFGKLGVAQMNYKVADLKTDKITTHFGAGASYSFTPALVMRAEYEIFDKVKFGNQSNSVSLNTSQISLGLDYRF